MTKPIEIIHQNFETKLATISQIIQKLSPTIGETTVTLYDKIQNDYQNHTLAQLCEYFETDDFKTKCHIVDRYIQIIVSKNFISLMNELVLCLKSHFESAYFDSTEVQLLFKTYYDTHVDVDIKKIDYKQCPLCAGKMSIHPYQSDMRCTSCNYIMRLDGTVFDENHMYTSEGALAKRGTYETSRHCRYHLDRILAIKNPNFPESFWAKVHAWLRRNNFIYLKLVTCPDYRRCLKDIKETHHNEHVPFIRQFVSGVSPERLFHSEVRKLFIYFDKAVTAFLEIQGGGRANLKYYPYFIYKIIEMILNKKEDRRRLRSIVDCIHFQRDNTIVANDRLWQKMCNRIPEFVFKKTDKNLL